VRHPAVTPNRSDERIPGSLATLVPRNDGAVPRMLRDAPRKRRGALLIRGPSISVCEDVGPGFSRSSVARCIASGTPDIACAKNRISQTQSTLSLLSSPRAKNISLIMSGKSPLEAPPSRARQEGRCASSETLDAGCDGRLQSSSDE